MADINQRLNSLNKGKKGKKKTNTLKEINTKKLINNFSEKYTNTQTNNNNTTTSKLKHLISENLAIISLAVIAFTFIVIGLYLYFKGGKQTKQGKTYYGDDLLSYQPLFKIETDKIEPCIERCEKDTLCSGITFNKDELQCVGTNKGRLRDDEPNQFAWVKEKKADSTLKELTLAGFTKSSKIIEPKDIPKPELPHQFTYSFYLYLHDFYENQGVWRHILHKGTDISKMNTPNWEDVVKEVPEQSIGVWLAPFHNNIRIALTTIKDMNKDTRSYPHANKQEYLAVEQTQSKPNVFITDLPSGPKRDMNRATLRNIKSSPNYQKYLEHIDITNIPVKKLVHITIVVHELVMEVYLNSKLHSIVELQGYPEFNSGSMTLLHPTAIKADILDLKYISGSLKYPELKKLINNKTELTGKYSLN